MTKTGRMYMKQDKNKRIRIFFIVLAAFCGMIWSVTNLGYDGEYQISMSYRLLQGDKMFLEMWEPHQTSVFLTAGLMWIYRSLFHTTTGIVVYLQVCGILVRGGIAVCLYRVLRNDLDESVAFFMGLLYFMLSPKDYALPEFSNQQLWFATLMLCCLWAYLKKGKRSLLVLGALWLCLDVLAYPSCVILYLGAVAILALYSSRKWGDILILTGVCAGGAILVGGLFLRIDPEVLMQCISGMLALEPTHTGSLLSKLSSYLKDFGEILLVIAAAGGAGLGLTIPTGKIWDVRGDARQPQKRWMWILCCAVVMLAGFLVNILSAERRNAYSIIFIFLIGVGLWFRGSLSGRESQAYVCGSMIGGLEFLATLTLTDLPVKDSVVYGLLAIVFALIPIGKQVEEMGNLFIRKGIHAVAVGFLVLLAFRCVYIRTPLTGRGQICSVLSDLSVVRSGPALGLITNEEGACIQRDSYPEWEKLIHQGDKVWIVGGVLGTMGYLYEDVEVAGPSTMSTPYYSEAILEYWRLNPGKIPDVVVAESYQGELVWDLQRNQWLMDWLREVYCPEQVVEGKYWMYYFKKAR